jgi:predicted CXXCH cytochrome family protein
VNIRNKIVIITIIITALSMTSCSIEKSYRVLSFFFDGVPNPVSDTVTASEDVLLSAEVNNQLISDTLSTDLIPVFTYHYPYEEKECSSCHDELSPGNMTLPEPDLCYMCHEDFSGKYTFIHGPVAGGYCTSCHNAHQSKNSYLLLRTGGNLCTWCHDTTEAPSNEMHDGMEDYDCTMCHNPHGGEDKMLIR